MYVQSESAHLTARIPVATCTVRGARARRREGSAGPRPHPVEALSRWGCAGSRTTPTPSGFFAMRWGRALLPAGGARTGGDSHVPGLRTARWGGCGVSLSRTRARLLLQDRRPRRAGVQNLRRRRTPRHRPSRAEPQGRRLRPFRTAEVVAGLRRAGAGRPAGGRRVGDGRRHQSNGQGGERRMPYYLDNEFLLDNPWITVVGCGGTGGFVAEGTLPPLPGAGGHHRPGRPRPGRAPQPAAPEFLPRGRGPLQERGSCEPFGAGVPKARGLLGIRLPGRRRPSLRVPLARPSAIRRVPHHRLRRQRRRSRGDGGESQGRPAPVAHRRGQRHQLGTGLGRQRGRPGVLGRARLRRRDLPPAARAHAAAARPADRRVEQAAGRGLRRPPSTSPTRTRPSTR